MPDLIRHPAYYTWIRVRGNDINTLYGSGKCTGLSKIMRLILKRTPFEHVKAAQITCMRSTGATSRAYARIWSFPKIWQKRYRIRPIMSLKFLLIILINCPMTIKSARSSMSLCTSRKISPERSSRIMGDIIG